MMEAKPKSSYKRWAGGKKIELRLSSAYECSGRLRWQNWSASVVVVKE
jgi:hypothetical protein